MHRSKKQDSSTVSSVGAREAIFVSEYLKDFNGVRAATAAGYSPRSARSVYSQLMARPTVRDRLRAALDARLNAADVTGERVITEAARIAFSNITEFVDVSELGVILRDFSELPSSATAAVQSVKSFPVKGGGLAVSFKLHDKLAALQLLGKYLGLLKDSVSVTGPGGGPLQIQHLSDDALLQIITSGDDADTG